MTVMQSLRRHFSARLHSKRRLTLEQLENRLVPSTSASIGVPAGPFPEGSAINLTASVVDQVGTTPSFSWTVLKNGSSFTTGTTTTGAFSFTPDDNGAYVVQMSVTDDANTTAATDVNLTVDNVAPTVSISGPTSGNFGTPLTFTINTSDVVPDVAVGFAYTVHWNDGTPDEVIAPTPGNSSIPVTHTFAVPGPNTFTVTATDKDMGVGTATQTVTTMNGAAVINGVLTVAGTNGADGIFFIPRGRPTAANANVRVLLDGQNLVFSGVNSILVYGLDGNDFIHLAGAIRVPATVFGGAGDDRIKGGKGSDLLVGGDGNDWINGGQGNDVIIGGQGFDRLIGGPGDDLLIANATSFDTDLNSLQTLRMEWLTPLTKPTLAARVAAVTTDATTTVHLTTGTGGTLIDDGATDRLTGTAGSDAFFTTVGQDIITDMHPFEFLNGVKGTPHGHGHAH